MSAETPVLDPAQQIADQEAQIADERARADQEAAQQLIDRTQRLPVLSGQPTQELPPPAIDTTPPDAPTTITVPVQDAPEPVAESVPQEPTTTGPQPTDPGEIEPEQLVYGRVNRQRDKINYRTQYAENRIATDLETGSRFRRTVKRVFEGRLLRRHYEERYKLAYDREVQESHGLLEVPLELLRGSERDEAITLGQRAAAATTEWAISQDEQMGDLRRTGEQAADISGNPEVDGKLRTALKDISLRYASGELNDETIIAERDRQLSEIEGLNGELFGKGVGFSDNIIELARSVRAMVEHDNSQERAVKSLDALELRGAFARGSAEAEVRRTVMDRISEKVGMSRIGGTGLATAVITASAIVFCGTQKGATSGVSTALRLTGVGAGAAGAIAAAYEYGAVRREASLVRQEAAYGYSTENQTENRRRQRMDDTIVYRAEDVADTTEELKLFLGEEGTLRSDLTDTEILDAQAMVTRMRTLINQSDTRRIDLLQFTGVANAATERLDMLYSIMAVEAALESRVAEGGVLNVQGLGDNPVEVPIERALELTRVTQETSVLIDTDENVHTHDRAYKAMMAKRLAIAFAAGTVSGLVVGEVIQEGAALINPNVTGVFEGQVPGHPNTLLQTLLHGQHNGGGVQASGANHVATHLVTHPGSAASFALPDGVEAHYGANSAVDLVNKSNGHSIAQGLQYDKNGSLTHGSLKTLDGLGIAHGAHSTLVAGTPHDATANQFYQANKHLMVHSHNTLMMNDTQYADFNELHFYAAGEHGSWFDEHGNVHIRVDGITPNGSFEGADRVNPVEAVRNGQLKVFMSVDKAHGLDNFAFTVHEHNGHYEVLINKNNPAHQLFGNRTGEGGAAEGFQGRYLGAAVDKGANASGVHDFHVINSVEGGDNAKLQVTPHAHHTVNTLHLQTVTSPEGETLPVFGPPIYPRRGVGRTREEVGQVHNPNLAPMYYGGKNLEELQEWIARDPSLLKTRQLITEADGTKRWVEADGSPVTRDVTRERQALQSYLESERAASPEHYAAVERVAEAMRPMHQANRVSVNIPAHMEESHLRGLLEGYTAQVDASGTTLNPDLYEINILVNRRTGMEPDQSVQTIQAFVDEFERVHGSRPHVNYYDIEIDPPFNNVGYARKLLTDAVALRSVRRDQQDGALYLESEDADLLKIDQHTVINALAKLDAHPELDAVRGVQDRTPGYLKDNDYLFMRRRAWDFFEILARNRRFRDPTNPNWNFTWNRVVTGGWNTAYSAEAYASIRGYESVESGEDMTVGQKITMIRGDGNLPNLEVIGTVSTRNDSSPRSFIDEIVTDVPVYADFANEERNARIRGRSVEAAMRLIKPYERLNESNEEYFQSYISNIYGWAQSSTPTHADAVQLTKRMLFFLGFQKDDYELDDNNLTIKSWDNLKSSLEGYRQRYDPVLGRARLAV